MAELGGVRVLITRPAAQATSWQAALVASGAACVTVPLLDIVPVSDHAEIEALKAIVMNIDHYQAAIFVSQNAVREGAFWLDRYWPQLPIGIDYFAVGKATAAALTRESITATEAGGAMNSEELLKLPALQHVSGKKIVIFRGCGGRTLLGDCLSDRGAEVTYCELYRRKLPEQAGVQLSQSVFGLPSGYTDLISAHSGETVTNLVSLINQYQLQHLLQLPIIVPGARVAALAQQYLFKEVIVAENAANEAMLSALINWYRDSK